MKVQNGYDLSVITIDYTILKQQNPLLYSGLKQRVNTCGYIVDVYIFFS